MFGQLFGKYLVKEKVLDEATLQDILSEQTKIRAKLGMIAVADKLITQEQAEEINKIQIEQDKRFGDIAVEKGYLTESQVKDLLNEQGNSYMQFLQVLVEKSDVKVSKIDGYLENFQKEQGFDKREMDALKRDDIDVLLPIFAYASKKYVTDIVGLVIRNITRFVTNNYYIGHIHTMDRLEYRCMVMQKCTGDADICIGFAMLKDNDSFSKIASRYVGEDLSFHNSDVLDAVGEFINCISGLLATALSHKNVNIEIKPQTCYENQVATGSAYVLPIYIEENEFDLYIAVDSNVTVGTMPMINKRGIIFSEEKAEESKGRILIVDDSGMSRKMLRNLLEAEGYSVVGEASDGVEGVLAYKQCNPDLVTLDITMPNMDGTQALRQIIDFDGDAKVIMITAAGQQNKIIEALKAGAEKFVTKPFEKKEVLKAVRETMESRRY